jgi:hypothetical protein
MNQVDNMYSESKWTNIRLKNSEKFTEGNLLLLIKIV